MKMLLNAVAVLTVNFGSLAALAADIPVKAPIVRPDPIPAWDGFYFGANVGYSAGRVERSASNAVLTGPSAGTIDRSFDERSLNGVVGGGQIGFNRQSSPNWVWGLEVDFQGSGQKSETRSYNEDLNGTGPTLQTTTVLSENKLEWFGTARLRAGYVVGNSLWFGTGGFAYGRVEQNDSRTRLPSVPGSASLAGAGSTSSTQSGWTAGGGVETKFSSNWSAKLEYLYMDLGKDTNAFNVLLTSGGGAGNVASNYTATSHFKDHIVRFGLNYQFR